MSYGIDPADFQYEVHKNSKDKGFWDANSDIGHKLMLIVSELAEALEEYRKGIDLKLVYESENGKPEGFPMELADAYIRLLDLSQYVGFDLYRMAKQKHLYNITRPHMHGKLS